MIPRTRGRRIKVLSLGSIPGLARSLESLPRPFRFQVDNSVTVEDLPDLQLVLYDVIALPAAEGPGAVMQVLKHDSTIPVVVFGDKIEESVQFVHKGAQDYLDPASVELPFRILSVIERFRLSGYPLMDDTGEFDAVTKRVEDTLARMLKDGDELSEGQPEGATAQRSGTGISAGAIKA